MELISKQLFIDFPLGIREFRGIPNKLAEIEVRYTNRVKSKDRIKLSSSEDAYQVFASTWNHATIQYYEEFKVLYLNRQNEILGLQTISQGGVAGTVVDRKIIFATAVTCVASSLIVAHNHPSLNLNPSQADRQITTLIARGAKLLEMQLLDHMIITAESYFSFADEGLL